MRVTVIGGSAAGMIWQRPVPAKSGRGRRTPAHEDRWEPGVTKEAERDKPTGDAAVVERARAGDPEAFGELTQRYTKRIYTLLYRLVGNREDAEDLTQESFIRAYRFLARYDTARPFRNWMYTIATNVGLNALRARRRRGERVTIDEAEGQGALWPGNPTTGHGGPERVAAEELRDRVGAALKQLPARSASLVHLHYHEGMSIREAATILGMNENAAKVALHRARRRMRALLVDEVAK